MSRRRYFDDHYEGHDDYKDHKDRDHRDFDRRDDKHHCDRCGHYHCECGRQGELVEKVILSKEVQKTAEFALPAAIGPLTPGLPALPDIIGLLGGVVNATIEPNFNNIQQEVTVLKDKVINLGYIPATLNVTLAAGDPLEIPIRIFFQEHTHCPGICPGDTVTETRPEVEAVLNEPLVGTDASGATFINLLLFKAVVRTHITVTRQGIERNGKFYDLNNRRCEPTTTPVPIETPLDLTAGPLPTPANGGVAPAQNTQQTNNNNNDGGTTS
ncbi:hypothetical protein ACFOGI_06815 [Virgibacillus xinjiangensis]|uniref:SipL SPOCS domain-containing protein n=1 Tax=Virgibacillus xinjiangensis TaxID=393090 RepID=A0ABV7CUL2_9BACI